MNVIASKLKPKPFNYQIPRSAWIYALHVSERSVRWNNTCTLHDLCWLYWRTALQRLQQMDGVISLPFLLLLLLCVIKCKQSDFTTKQNPRPSCCKTAVEPKLMVRNSQCLAIVSGEQKLLLVLATSFPQPTKRILLIYNNLIFILW